MKNNYPAGAEYDPNAPWNQEDNKECTIKVTVSQTLSKTVEIKVADYSSEAEINEDGNYNIYYDFSECDLKQAVQDQILLPSTYFKDWVEDDFEVIME